MSQPVIVLVLILGLGGAGLFFGFKLFVMEIKGILSHKQQSKPEVDNS